MLRKHHLFHITDHWFWSGWETPPAWFNSLKINHLCQNRRGRFSTFTNREDIQVWHQVYFPITDMHWRGFTPVGRTRNVTVFLHYQIYCCAWTAVGILPVKSKHSQTAETKIKRGDLENYPTHQAVVTVSSVGTEERRKLGEAARKFAFKNVCWLINSICSGWWRVKKKQSLAKISLK